MHIKIIRYIKHYTGKIKITRRLVPIINQSLLIIPRSTEKHHHNDGD
jgi:hypothetical protein